MSYPPEWLVEAYHNDALVHRVMMDCAHVGMTPDEKIAHLCRCLYVRTKQLEKLLIEQTSLKPPVLVIHSTPGHSPEPDQKSEPGASRSEPEPS